MLKQKIEVPTFAAFGYGAKDPGEMTYGGYVTSMRQKKLVPA